MKKQCNVVMLPTEKESNIVIYRGETESFLSYYEEGRRVSPTKEFAQQHLYILSDDEIKNNDFILYCLDKEPIQYKENCMEQSIKLQEYGYKKIIASTDKSIQALKFEGSKLEAFSKILVGVKANISESFVQKYIFSYNKGERIDKVMVEYEHISPYWENQKDHSICFSEEEVNKQGGSYIYHSGDKLKVNSKTNSIIITKIKNSWTRDEVISLLNKGISEAIMYPENFVTGICFDSSKFDLFIENNL